VVTGGPPPDLQEFPELPEPAAAGPFHRIWRARDAATGAVRPPWWFAGVPSAPLGRFDLPAPEGTCHLSTTLAGAWLEVFRGTGLVDRADADRRRLLSVRRGGGGLRLADLPAARRAGSGSPWTWPRGRTTR